MIDPNTLTDTEIRQYYDENNIWGLCTTVDLTDCNPDLIRSPEHLHQFIIDLCTEIDMNRFGEPLIVHFGANEKVAGYSIVQLIETSCITGHFANDTNAAYLDIFSCKSYNPRATALFCKNYFQASAHRLRVSYR